MHEFGAGTHVGNVRDNNEDSFVCDPDKELWIVADGMGGLGFGEVASAISTYTVAKQIQGGHGVNQAIELAHKNIKDYAETEALGTNMGTTIVLLLSQGSLYNIFWVGDSRAYLYDNKSLSQLTVDHSLVQSLIDQGEITSEEARSDPRKNAVTKALGVQELETVRADSISDKWQPGQKIMLCSDGLTDCVDNDAICQIFREAQSDQECVDKLIEAALANGGKDNITIILVSATSTTKQQDSDTHVPGDITDRTYVPQSDTQSGSDDLKRLESGPQEPYIQRPTQGAEEDSESINKWFDWQQWLVGAAIVLSVVIFARLSVADKPAPAPAFSAEMIRNDTASLVPMTRHAIPNIELPEPGAQLQLGLFNRLEGAEQQQALLARVGLLPQIEKRAVDKQVQYAVVFGPFQSEQAMTAITTVLDEENFSYFKRPERGF